ncbi:nitrous oxide-stimulated promoter family protein [Desulfuromusa kysingii]|uniref:nitrous oxide-stimulated promoter family protein n=1 Tax=Desulfuromusa kysingii TaxID=37625 RepID=UPI000B843536
MKRSFRSKGKSSPDVTCNVCEIWRQVLRRVKRIKKQSSHLNLTLTRKQKKDLKVLALFTSVYCHDHHPLKKESLSGLDPQLAALERFSCCQQCQTFLLYAIERRLNCPLVEKPACKHCQVHCYSSEYREKVREIMRYSGKALIKKGRLDLLWYYFF